MKIELSPRLKHDGTVFRISSGWRLAIPAGTRQVYRLAQLDDYASLARSHFHHTPPWSLRLRVRVSESNLPGTWGFGLWNDPFGLSLGFGGRSAHLPTLPQAVWFMHASPPNWLSIRDKPSPSLNHQIPANGFFAGTYRSKRIPSSLLALTFLFFPFLELRLTSRVLRRLSNRLIQQDMVAVNTDVAQWHEYSIHWLEQGCMFTLDGSEILTTPNSPRSPLGLVIWMDNQFAAWTPEGRLGYGTLENPPAWMEIQNLILQKP